MNPTEEALLEALNETRDLARELADGFGYLLAVATDSEVIAAAETQSGQAALLGWKRFDIRITELLAEAI